MMHPGPARGGQRRGPMAGGPMAMMKGERAHDFKGTMLKLFNYLGKYRVSLIIALFIAATSTVATIFGPKVMARAIDELVSGVMAMSSGTGSIDFVAIGNILLETAGLYILSAGLSFASGWILTGVSMDITYRLRKNLSEKINRMPLKYFDGTNHGEILSRVTNDVATVSQTLSQSLSTIISSVTGVIGALIMMLSISWILTLVAILIIPLSMIFLRLILPQSQKYFSQQQDYLGHVNGHVEEMFSGHIVVKAFNGEKKSIEKFEGYNNTLYEAGWKSQFLTGLLFPIMNFIGNLGYVAISILGAWLALLGRVTVGDIVAFLQYIRSFTQPLTQIANISNILQQTAAAAERVFEFLAESEEIKETENPIQLPAITGHVEFRDVHFGYNPEKIIINDFSASVKPGQKVAIVGPTGAGKTTMVKLLMRFYDVNSGAIRIDGHDLREFSRGDLRCLFGMVLQDTWLYNGNIRENIRYGRPEATDEEVIAAAKAARVDHFVRTLSEGYDMVLNEETTNISQGQMQLMTIARAVLADPTMLILDEATSSVDTRTEILIQEAMDELMKGRTSFIIAHRLSTIRNADLILVMEHGDIVEQGTHEELLARNGAYAEMYNSQFEHVMAV
ncbi:MAG: multidrug ABC transporter ATP-binding protein [Anaerolineales bacterium]|nr:MAG: multidrug ABC transporter ATP-binding protein [Anaerolineales bacterium]